ncbi:nitrite reductase (NAD(P)H) small subunit [Streptomyces sp. WMMB 322]|uniref:nitrite reductase (NAD(P)H) small subunit n=1 Tax=Streptomyces sp. WMMB 322 TaxID=1286821 RepID=UPI000823A193|nr:nitrite reductase (NAD(P)H) small subunit [Streptomyces sp. WMMB 322]SCK40019.1 nitrite reductase (NADH) small subunit [Streptomyces sp. WMMB 322]
MTITATTGPDTTTATRQSPGSPPDAAPARGTRTAGGSVGTAVGPRLEVRDDRGWFTVCGLDDLVPGRGVAALLRDGSQAAVFMDRAGRTYVIGNRDPFTGAYVLSRGLLGSTPGDPAGAEAPETPDERTRSRETGRSGWAPFVASPLLKQRFDLRTGRCLDDESVSVPVFRSRTRTH